MQHMSRTEQLGSGYTGDVETGNEPGRDGVGMNNHLTLTRQPTMCSAFVL